MASTPITRQDLESKFRLVQDSFQGTMERSKKSLATAGAVAGVILLIVMFLLGSRRGKKKTTLVEIRRL